MELNGNSFNVRKDGIPNMKALLAACLQNGCHIAVDSDAHSTWQLRHGLTALYGMLEEMNFPEELIINATTANLTAELKLHGKACAEAVSYTHLHGSSIFAKLAQAELDGKKTFPFTSGKNLYDFIDVDELANMIVAASVQEEINGIINVCTGEPRSLADRVEQFLRDKNYKIKLDYGAFPDRPYDSPGTWGDATKIKQILAKDQL